MVDQVDVLMALMLSVIATSALAVVAMIVVFIVEITDSVWPRLLALAGIVVSSRAPVTYAAIFAVHTESMGIGYKGMGPVLLSAPVTHSRARARPRNRPLALETTDRHEVVQNHHGRTRPGGKRGDHGP